MRVTRPSRLIPNLPRAEITRWPGSLDATIPGKRDSLQWETFLGEFLEKRQYLGDGRHPGWSAAVLRNNKRSLVNVEAVTAAVVEYDDQSGLSIQDIEATWGKFYGLVHTTKSHADDKLSCRVILPLQRHISAAEWRMLWPLLNEHSGGVIDPAPKDASRLWYMPGVIDDGPYYAAWLDGDPLSPDEWLARIQPKKREPRKAATDGTTRAVAYLDKMPAAISGQAGHQATWRAAVALARGFDLDEDTTFRILRDHYNPRCEPPWTDKELRHKAVQARDSSTLPRGYLLERSRGEVNFTLSDSDIGQPPPPLQETEDEWRRSLRFNERGMTKDAGNAALILANDPEWSGVLQYDSFRDLAFWAKAPPQLPGLISPRKGDAVADHHEIYVQHYLAKFRGTSFSKEAIFAALIAAARATEVHPVRDYLDSLRWDGASRVDAWLSRYLGAKTGDYTAGIGAWWLISAVARVQEPGCQADHMLVLEGAQGKGKTSAVRVLAGDWFLPRLPDLRDKDSMQVLLGHWICEIGELDAIKGKAATQVKDYISATVDVYRPSYGRATIRRPRQIVFIGTTNDDAYLTDATGARRFWPVTVGAIDLPALVQDRDQLWAEAAHRYHAGEPWHPRQELRDKIASEQDDRSEGDPWEERIAAWVANKDAFTVPEVLSVCLSLEPAKMDRAAQTRVGNCLRRLGYRSRQTRTGGQKRRVYDRVTDPDS